MLVFLLAGSLSDEEDVRLRIAISEDDVLATRTQTAPLAVAEFFANRLQGQG